MAFFDTIYQKSQVYVAKNNGKSRDSLFTIKQCIRPFILTEIFSTNYLQIRKTLFLNAYK